MRTYFDAISAMFCCIINSPAQQQKKSTRAKSCAIVESRVQSAECYCQVRITHFHFLFHGSAVFEFDAVRGVLFDLFMM